MFVSITKAAIFLPKAVRHVFCIKKADNGSVQNLREEIQNIGKKNTVPNIPYEKYR